MTKELFTAEIRFSADETRQTPGRLTGVLMTYETRASDRPEMFAADALVFPDGGIVINEQHNRQAPILRAMPTVEDRAVLISAELPNTSRGRDAGEMVRAGILTGLSVEFHAISEEIRDGLRYITKAFVPRAGLVDDPSYDDSLVAVRAKLIPETPETVRFRRWE